MPVAGGFFGTSKWVVCSYGCTRDGFLWWFSGLKWFPGGLDGGFVVFFWEKGPGENSSCEV